MAKDLHGFVSEITYILCVEVEVEVEVRIRHIVLCSLYIFLKFSNKII